jgi:hypothetical protein
LALGFKGLTLKDYRNDSLRREHKVHFPEKTRFSPAKTSNIYGYMAKMTNIGPNDLDIATISRSILAMDMSFLRVEMEFLGLETAFVRELLDIHRADMD